MIKYLMEKEFKQLPSQCFSAAAYFYFPLYDYDSHALGCEYGDTQYLLEYNRQ